VPKECINSCICSVAFYGAETWTVGENEERVLEKNVKNKMDRWNITNGEVFQRMKE
jgi:hypothetical protein